MAAVEDTVEVASERGVEDGMDIQELAIVQEPVFVEESTVTEDVAQAVILIVEQASEVSTLEGNASVKHALNGNAPVFALVTLRRNSSADIPSSTVKLPPTWDSVDQVLSPELLDEPVFPTVPELPTVEKVNEILYDILWRLQREAREKEAGMSGVIARFCGSPAPPPPPSAPVDSTPAPIVAPALTTTSTPLPTLPAAPKPMQIMTFTRARLTRRR
ncbi:hypothetical protein BDV93DRAFT_556735 [Ceratobasidium sp. AG-I]|nr:hypothetical protein BDV93DRAFT_556735 [Ceratobasidium sp. AG-I]